MPISPVQIPNDHYNIIVAKYPGGWHLITQASLSECVSLYSSVPLVVVVITSWDGVSTAAVLVVVYVCALECIQLYVLYYMLAYCCDA